MLRSDQGQVLVLFGSFVLIYFSQAFIITRVVRFLDRSRFILFMGFLLVLLLLDIVYL
jgi:hypothetical protein